MSPGPWPVRALILAWRCRIIVRGGSDRDTPRGNSQRKAQQASVPEAKMAILRYPKGRHQLSSPPKSSLVDLRQGAFSGGFHMSPSTEWRNSDVESGDGRFAVGHLGNRDFFRN